MEDRVALPALPFGDDIAVVHERAQCFGDLIDRVFPGVNAYDPLPRVKHFRSKAATVRMPQSTLVAAAISPTHVERKNNPQLTFMWPMAGDAEAVSQVGRDRLTWGLGHGGVFLPCTDTATSGSGGFRSQLMWNLDGTKLTETARAMLGLHDDVDLRLDQTRVLPKAIAGLQIEAAMKAALPLVSVHRRNPLLLAQLGFEDFLYRQTVMLLRPDCFQEGDESGSDSELGAQKHRQVLDILCEYILAHLGDPLTLTDLETVAGLSARTLQLAFNERFACTPMAWIKEQRLMKVRGQLLNTPREVSVESVALSTGFQTMPAFYLAYKKRFGETPGQNRQRH